MSDQWYSGFNSLNISDPYATHDGNFRSYHGDDSHPGSPGGNFPHGRGTGRAGPQQPFPAGHRLPRHDDSPYLPARGPPPQQYVSPGDIMGHRGSPHPQWPNAVPSLPSLPSYAPPPPTAFPTALPPSAFHQPLGSRDSSGQPPDAGSYLREQLNLAPGTPVDLRCFPEPLHGEKPTASLINLVKVAIYGSPKRCLPLQGIYDALMFRFRYFRENPGGPWTRSIRHLLSLKAVFVKVNRPVTDPGKGVYWQLDITQGEGDKRVRKRMYKGNPPVLSTEGDDEDDELVSDSEYGSAPNSASTASSRSSGRMKMPPSRTPSRTQSTPMLGLPPPQNPRPAHHHHSQPYGRYDAMPGEGQFNFYPMMGDPDELVDVKPPRSVQPLRAHASMPVASSSSGGGRLMSPTDEAYAKSRRHAGRR